MSAWRPAPSSAADFLAPHVPALRETAPALRLELIVGRRLVDLARREADVALRLRPPGAVVAEPSVIATKVSKIVWGLYALAGRRAKREAAPARVIRYVGMEPGAAWMVKHAAASAVTARVDDVPTALALARAGVGAAVLPCFLADPDPALVRVAANVDEHRLFVAVHADLRDTPRVAAVLKWLRSVVDLEKPRLEGRNGR